MRVAVLTSVDTRHRYFANVMARHMDVVAVVYEQTGYSPARTFGCGLSKEEESVVAAHFDERARQEDLFFGKDAGWIRERTGTRVIQLVPGALNSPRTLNFVRGAKPDVVLVYGTNLIRDPLLSTFSGRMVNLHLGLSPYYRGTATNFYPLLNEEPEYVGATIHVIDAGIDSGPILAQVRPRIVAGDQPHTIGCKAILAAVNAMATIVADWHSGRLTPVPQWKPATSRLYLRKDYHPRQVVDLAQRMAGGLIDRWLPEAPRRLAAVKLVEPSLHAAGAMH